MLNEATLQVGTRPDQYITLPVTMLDRLNKLIIDGTVFEFKKTTPGTEVLMRCKASRARRPSEWSYVFDKDSRRIFRTMDRGIITVEWS